MKLQTTLEEKLTGALAPIHLEVANESFMHSVPAGSESHFKVVAVSAVFEGKPLVNRHRIVNDLFAAELRDSIHALALHLYTPAEWAKKNEGTPPSPPCLGGSQRG